MNSSEQKIFWDIINCPQYAASALPRCQKVLSAQTGPTRQVPEPWSGHLSQSSFLLIGGNPTIVDNEVFPSTDATWSRWAPMPGTTNPWSLKRMKAPFTDIKEENEESDNVEDFFEDRFDGAMFPPQNKPYVNIKSGTTLRILKGTVVSVPFQNKYWPTYNAYCKAIDPSFIDYSFVVTDFVHCKSKAEFGVSQAMCYCTTRHMNQIIDCFLNNNKESHNILIFGQNDDYVAKAKSWLASLGALSNRTNVGSFIYKNANSRKNGQTIPIERWDFVMGGVSASVFFYIPKPSGANHASCPVTFKGHKIVW